MSEKKLFSPEDFDKPSVAKRHTGRYVVIATAVTLALVAALVVLTSRERGEAPSIAEVADASEAPITSQSLQADKAEVLTPSDSVPIIPAEAPETSVSSSDESADALDVIRGNYGNNPVRRRLLGDRYESVQQKVNEIIRSGKY